MWFLSFYYYYNPSKSLHPSADLCDVSQWLLVLDEHLGKLQALFWVDSHHIPEQKDPIWSVAHLEKKHCLNPLTLRTGFSNTKRAR